MKILHWHWGLLVLLCYAVQMVRKRKQGKPSVTYPGLADFQKIPVGFRVRLHQARPWLQGLAVVFLALALARPQAGKTVEIVHAKGVDIMVALDVSGSMAGGRDLRPNRLAVAKEVLSNFVSGRKHDRIGLVVFAGAAFTRCPLTLDYSILTHILASLNENTVAVDGTAIGTALGACINRLRDSDAQSKVVILLTDGANNAGAIAPEDASAMAQQLGIKVYTIGVGSDGKNQGNQGLGFLQLMRRAPKLDEPLLRSLAEKTGGRYFRATDETALQGILQIIDRLERSELEARSFTRYRELARPLVLLGLGLLFLDLLLGVSILGALP